jgi:hypothetical protein
MSTSRVIVRVRKQQHRIFPPFLPYVPPKKRIHQPTKENVATIFFIIDDRMNMHWIVLSIAIAALFSAAHVSAGTEGSVATNKGATTTATTTPRSATDFVRLGLPFSLFRNTAARLTGVAVVHRQRFNTSDSRPAFIFSGGRHALSGQGWLLFQDGATDRPSFSAPAIPFGALGGYNGAAALAPPAVQSSTAQTNQSHHMFLLAGGICLPCSSSDCYNGARGCLYNKTPARLFSAKGLDDNGEVPVIREVWKEPTGTSNRAGALVNMAGDQAPTARHVTLGRGRIARLPKSLPLGRAAAV